MSEIAPIRKIKYRFRIYRGSGPVDLTSFLNRARVDLGDVSTVGTGNAGGDGVSATAEFVLANDRPAHDSLHPNDTTSEWNKPTPLLSPNRRVTLEVSATPEGEADAPFVMVFDGIMGDGFRTTERGATVTVQARDYAKRLMDIFAWAEEERTYGTEAGEPIENVLQQMLDDNNTGITLFVDGAPEFLVRPYAPQHTSVWDMMQQLVVQTGWYLGFRRHDDGVVRLTLMDPPREKVSADWDFNGDDVITASVDQSDADMRTSAVGFYVDANTKERTRVPPSGFIENTEAVGELGVRKVMVFEEDNTSQIDTAGEMQTLLERAVHDLSHQFAATQVQLPALPELRLFDMIRVHLPRVGSAQSFAVNNLQHTLDVRTGRAQFRTTISGVAKVVGKRRQWLRLEPRPGSPSNPAGPHQVRLLPPVVTLLPGQPGFVVEVDYGRSRGVRASGVEVHWSTSQGFTPSANTLRASGPENRFEFTPGNSQRVYVRVRSVGVDGELGPLSSEQSIVPATIDGNWLVLDDNVDVTGDFRVRGENVQIDGDTTFHGDIEISGGGSGGGTLIVTRDGNTVVALGDITGLPGVPDSRDGLWLDTNNAYIRNAGMLLQVGIARSFLFPGEPPQSTTGLDAEPHVEITNGRAGGFTTQFPNITRDFRLAISLDEAWADSYPLASDGFPTPDTDAFLFDFLWEFRYAMQGGGRSAWAMAGTVATPSRPVTSIEIRPSSFWLRHKNPGSGPYEWWLAYKAQVLVFDAVVDASTG